MKSVRDCLSWGIALVMWMSGALLLWKIWQFQKALSDPLGSYIEFTLMFVATFYVVALVPLKSCADWVLSRGRQHSPALVSP